MIPALKGLTVQWRNSFIKEHPPDDKGLCKYSNRDGWRLTERCKAAWGCHRPETCKDICQRLKSRASVANRRKGMWKGSIQGSKVFTEINQFHVPGASIRYKGVRLRKLPKQNRAVGWGYLCSARSIAFALWVKGLSTEQDTDRVWQGQEWGPQVLC